MPILKRGEERKIRDFRGVTLTPSLYKVYAMMLAEGWGEGCGRQGIDSAESSGVQKGKEWGQ